MNSGSRGCRSDLEMTMFRVESLETGAWRARCWKSSVGEAGQASCSEEDSEGRTCPILQDDGRACTREELLVELADFARNLDDIDAALRKAASEGEVELGKRGLFKARRLGDEEVNIDL